MTDVDIFKKNQRCIRYILEKSIMHTVYLDRPITQIKIT